MTREHKIALIVGFSLVLVVGILISDHMSAAGRARVETNLASNIRSDESPDAPLPMSDLPTEAEPIETIAATPRPTTAPEANGPIARALSKTQDDTSTADRTESSDAESATDAPSLGDRLARLREQWENGVRPPPAAQMSESDNDDPEAKADADDVEDVRIRFHPVQKGQTLWRIAEAYYSDGSLAKPLAEFNKDRAPDPDALRAGVTLRIPPRSVLLGEKRPTRRRASENAPPKRPMRKYTVKKGDTLGEIAQRLLGTVRRADEIIELNKDVIDDPDTIPAGVTLKIPPS